MSGQHSYAKTSDYTASRPRAPLWTMAVAPGERCMSSSSPPGDILALRKAVIDLEAFELCVIVAVVRHNTPAQSGWAVAAEASRENATSSEILRASCIVWCPS